MESAKAQQRLSVAVIVRCCSCFEEVVAISDCSRLAAKMLLIARWWSTAWRRNAAVA